MTQLDKVRGMILGGAIGDALGAPLEGERDFQVLLDKFGPGGVQEYIDPISPFDDKTDFTHGETTDDTASIIGATAALYLSGNQNLDSTLDHLWQANLIWGSHQLGGEDIAQFVDTKIEWPEWYTPFFASTGAGRGTIAALLEGRMGTPENPMSPNRMVRGKQIAEPNKGCGGMMRVAPVGLLPLEDEQTADLAVRSTAITHGAPEAQAASAVIALAVKNAFNGASVGESIYLAMLDVDNFALPGHEKCRKAYEAASHACYTKPVSCETANALPKKLRYTNAFLAIPVLSQVFYATMIAEDIRKEEANDETAFLKILGICTTISGDSDSVGSIVGNILGASWGSSALPQSLLAQLGNKAHLEDAAQALHQTILKFEAL